MLTPDERYYKWDDFRKLITELVSKVEDELAYSYCPYGKKKDNDAPFAQFLFDFLDLLNDYAIQHSQVLWEQFCKWEDEKEEAHLDDVLSDVLSWQFPSLHDVGGVLFV